MTTTKTASEILVLVGEFKTPLHLTDILADCRPLTDDTEH